MREVVESKDSVRRLSQMRDKADVKADPLPSLFV